MCKMATRCHHSLEQNRLCNILYTQILLIDTKEAYYRGFSSCRHRHHGCLPGPRDTLRPFQTSLTCSLWLFLPLSRISINNKCIIYIF
ncbi:hypothetical protein FKM82_008429 [Ascaphus truei]